MPFCVRLTSYRVSVPAGSVGLCQRLRTSTTIGKALRRSQKFTVMYVQDTIVAPATPPGDGEVAIVRLSGPAAIRILRSIWHPLRTGELKPRLLVLGEIRDPETNLAIDRALAVVMPGPRSLTGEDVAELHCHGGPFLVRRVVGLALDCGARVA